MITKWDKRFLKLCVEVGTWSSCLRREVGCIIAKNNRIIAQGYNGAPAGFNTCRDKGYCHKNKLGIESGPCECYAVHAEQNAILQAAKMGISIDGATIYITHKPCDICTKLILNCGIARIVYIHDYDSKWSDKLIKESGIEIEQYEGEL